jgi:hypothetical protein
MAIGTDAAIEFFGTQDTLTNSSAAVVADAYSVSASQTAWTNNDDALYGRIVLSLTYGVAPTAGAVVSVYMRRLNIDGTSDEPTPDDNNQGSWVGSVTVDNVTTAQIKALDCDLKNFDTSQQYEFYLKNGADQTLSAGSIAKITPAAVGPHA